MGNKFNFEGYPNYQFFKNHIQERCVPSANNISCRDKNAEFQVQQIISKNSLSPVIEFTLPFPFRFPALELVDSTTYIKDISTNILKDMVLINGNIHKRISYIFYEGSYGSQGTDLSAERTLGSIKVLSADIPFGCSVKAINVRTTDKIDIEYAGTDSSSTIDILDTPMAVNKNKVTLYKNINEKLVIYIRFNVLRSIQTNL